MSKFKGAREQDSSEDNMKVEQEPAKVEALIQRVNAKKPVWRSLK